MFDQKKDRINYSDFLKPEPDYYMDYAVCMTYSLNLEALMAVPLSCGLLSDCDIHMNETALNLNPFALLESLRKSTDKYAVFCNYDGIHIPRDINSSSNSLFPILEKCIFPVNLGNGKNFHPKLWIIQYKSKTKPTLIKVVVLSRNLTFDNSLDLFVELSGLVNNSTENQKNKPLADMLTYLADNHCNSDVANKKIKNLAKNLLFINDFELDKEFEDYTFMPFGIPNYNSEDVLKPANNTLIISPFLSKNEVSNLFIQSKNRILATRDDSLDKNIFNLATEVYIPNSLYLNDSVLQENQTENDEFAIKRDLHAKIIYKENAKGNFLYLGSLNTTSNALHRNIEFMLRLKYKNQKDSFKTIKDTFLPEGGFFERKFGISPSTVQKTIDNDSKALAQVLSKITNAAVFKSDTNYRIIVNFNNLETEDLKAEIKPLFGGKIKKIAEQVTFENFKLKDLSEFYIVSYKEKKCIAKISTTNLPVEERDNEIFNSIISNKPDFYSYILFLLSSDYTSGTIEYDKFKKNIDTGSYSSNEFLSPSIYEKLLKAVVVQPEKINDIIDVMKRLSSAKIDNDFIQFINIFKSV